MRGSVESTIMKSWMERQLDSKQGSRLEMTKLQRFAKWLLDKNSVFCSTASRSQKMYAFGYSIALFAIVVRLAGFNSGLNLLYFVMLMLGVGVTSDLVMVYKRVWESTLGKAVILLAYFVLSNIALGLSENAINIVTKVDFVSVVYTKAILTVIMIPLFAWGISVFLLTMSFVFLPFVFMFVVMRKDFALNPCLGFIGGMFNGYLSKTTLAARFFAFLLLFGFVKSEGQDWARSYDGFLEKQLPFSLYLLEGRTYTSCILNENERGVKGEDGRYLIIKNSDDEYSFRTAMCKKSE
ncbi:hypothetical protein PS659_01636 [Pseudomonas fluorescens]|uniref:Transmembrane protein n=2 Tax=Pseudomonas fluorescens TaxID=294 RepID=A0A5E6RR46_PSEFL|nr:hypothetical protein PS659_01636 [Pseudomonas fluorescens]